MFKFAVSVVLLSIGPVGMFAQLDPEQMPNEWLPEQFPNPMQNPQSCGLSEAGYVCDPNRILSDHERKTLDWLLKGVVTSDTPCPCSVWACEQKKQGFSVSIAIMKKMKIPNRSMKPLDQAQVFAHYLETTKWKFGRCQEGIVVLYSKEDSTLQFMAGKTASKYVTNDVARAIGNHVAYNFRNGEIHHGLYELVLLLRSVLNNNKMEVLAPSAQALRGGVDPITVTLSTLLMTIITAVIIS